MLRAYKYRICPNVTQSILLAKTFGCVRYFWNEQVKVFNGYNKETNPKPVYKTSTEMRHAVPFMLEVSAAAIQQKENDFKEIRNQFFSKTRKKKIGRPKLKIKNNRQGFRLPVGKFDVFENRIRLEKIGYIRIVIDRPLPECHKLMSVTVSKETTGDYFASVLVETTICHIDKTGERTAIDVGLTTFATLLNEEEIPNPRFFRKNQARLSKLQKALKHKKKGSNRRSKLKKKIAKAYKRSANQRNNFLQEQSTQIVRKYDLIKVEDLNIAGLSKKNKPKKDRNGKYLHNGQARKRGLNKSILDAGWGMFINMIEYKAKWYGKEFKKADRFFASSKICSGCGHKKNDLKLSERIWECNNCKQVNRRDHNATANLDAVGVDAAKRA